MIRNYYVNRLALVGTLLVLVATMPIMLQSTRIQREKGQENFFPPRAAAYPNYLYAIGTLYNPGSDNAHFNTSYGVAVNATGHLYVADSNNQRVQIFNNAGKYQYTIGVTQEKGSDNAHFNQTTAVALNASGYLYVADTNNHRVQVFDNAGHYQYTIGTPGVSGGDNAHFNLPQGLTLNGTGYLYVADSNNNRVQVFDNAGVYQNTIGTGFGPGVYQLKSPIGVGTNATGHVFIADTDNYRVQVFDNAGIYQYTIGTTGVVGDDNAHLYGPSAVAVNMSGYVYIADSFNHRVQVFSSAGIFQHNITGYAYLPWGIAFNATGHVYISDPFFTQVFVHGVPAPTGLTIAIKEGAADTNITSVNLTLGATGATQMCFSNNGTTYTNWEAYGTSKAWTLAGGPGPKTVYFKTRCDLSEAGPVLDTINYTLTPSGLSINVADGAPETPTLAVTLTLEATGATQMCFSNNGTSYTAWEAFSTTKVWTLASGPGPKTVYLKVKNNTLEAAEPATDNITYVVPPSALSLTINDGATMTASRGVTLVVGASDVEEICFSNDGISWSAWEPFTPAKAWGIAGGPGPKTVYFKARNSTIETTTSSSIFYTLAPTALSIIINDGAEESANLNVTLTLSVTGAEWMCFSNDGVTWSAWEPVASTKKWTLSATAGYKTVYFKARNGTIESVDPVAASITYFLPEEVPAWAWGLLVGVIVEGVALLAVIWVFGVKGRGKVIRPEFGSQKKTRLELLKGKMSLLKGKIFKQDATGTATGEKLLEEKVVEVPMKPTPTPAPVMKVEASKTAAVPAPAPAKKVEVAKPATAPAPEKKLEPPKPAVAPALAKKVEVAKPVAAPGPAKKVEAVKSTPTPAPEKKVETPTPPPATVPKRNVEAPKSVTKPTKKASKKASKKAAKQPPT